VRVTATPEISPAYTDSSHDPAVRRDLILIGVAATLVVAAVVAAGRVAWLLLHQSTMNFRWPFGGWQVNVAKALIGLTILAGAVGAAVTTAKLRRTLAGRTPHARAVMLAALLPGLLIGAQVLGPINSTLGWASDHSSQAAALRAQLRQQYIHDLTAPPQVPSVFPAASPALAGRLLTSATLGRHWYAIGSPPAQQVPLATTLAKQGALQTGSTAFTESRRGPTGWISSLFLIEHVTTFGTAAQASRYAATYHRNATQPCSCSLSATVDQQRRLALNAVVAHIWRVQFGAGRLRYAVFSRGTDAFIVSIDAAMNHVISPSEFMMVLRHAIARSGPTA
jgi:hypothetical protein